MMMSEIVYQNIYALNQIEPIATELLKLFKEDKLWAFSGSLGAGKTTLIKCICKQLGYENAVTSPTFSIINEYKTEAESMFHFDFYRLEKEQEAVDLGIFEYFDSGSLCFMEWPEKIENILLKESILHIQLNLAESHDERSIVVSRKI